MSELFWVYAIDVEIVDSCVFWVVWWDGDEVAPWFVRSGWRWLKRWLDLVLPFGVWCWWVWLIVVGVGWSPSGHRGVVATHCSPGHVERLALTRWMICRVCFSFSCFDGDMG